MLGMNTQAIGFVFGESSYPPPPRLRLPGLTTATKPRQSPMCYSRSSSVKDGLEGVVYLISDLRRYLHVDCPASPCCPLFCAIGSMPSPASAPRFRSRELRVLGSGRAEVAWYVVETTLCLMDSCVVIAGGVVRIDGTCRVACTYLRGASPGYFLMICSCLFPACLFFRELDELPGAHRQQPHVDTAVARISSGPPPTR